MMQTMKTGYRGVSLLIGLNWDRFFSVATILAGLTAGAILGNMILNP
jgi:hypothetical protein